MTLQFRLIYIVTFKKKVQSYILIFLTENIVFLQNYLCDMASY